MLHRAALSQFSNINIEAKLKELIYKNNEYLGYALMMFINDTFKKINESIETLGIDKKFSDIVSLSLLNQLNNISFIRAYTSREIKRETYESYDVDMYSLSAYIVKHIPALTTIDNYVGHTLGINDQKRAILSDVVAIRREINLYQNKNKRHLVDDFNKKVDHLMLSIKDKPYFDARSEVQAGLPGIISDLDRDENDYYSKFRFFASYQKSNSSLRPKIAKAMDILARIQNDDVLKDFNDHEALRVSI